jgi:hypothetical protein
VEPHGFLTTDRFKLASIEPVQVDAAMLFHRSRLSRKLERRDDQMDTSRAGHLRDARNRALHIGCHCLHQIGQFVNDNDM